MMNKLRSDCVIEAFKAKLDDVNTTTDMNELHNSILVDDIKYIDFCNYVTERMKNKVDILEHIAYIRKQQSQNNVVSTTMMMESNEGTLYYVNINALMDNKITFNINDISKVSAFEDKQEKEIFVIDYIENL